MEDGSLDLVLYRMTAKVFQDVLAWSRLYGKMVLASGLLEEILPGSRKECPPCLDPGKGNCLLLEPEYDTWHAIGSAWGEVACDAGPDVVDEHFLREKGCTGHCARIHSQDVEAGAGWIFVTVGRGPAESVIYYLAKKENAPGMPWIPDIMKQALDMDGRPCFV